MTRTIMSLFSHYHYDPSLIVTHINAQLPTLLQLPASDVIYVCSPSKRGTGILFCHRGTAKLGAIRRDILAVRRLARRWKSVARRRSVRTEEESPWNNYLNFAMVGPAQVSWDSVK